jgi:hypothetical protein
MYFSTANPGMKYGGVMGESKYRVLKSIPKEYIPRSYILKSPISLSNILRIVRKEGISYPFIIKPDVGERGKDVELVNSEKELVEYLKTKTFDLIIQEYVKDGLEFGIMYHRIPGSKKGNITSVVKKGFLFITGDGKSTLKELIKKEVRTVGRYKYLIQKYKQEADKIPSAEQKIYLEPIGNHCRGTIFYNANDIINEKLNNLFDEIANQIDGYYYGRFDLKVPSLQELYSGQNIQIFELNGVSSEVAHVYDPDFKMSQAYKDIAKHMKYIYIIAKKNHELGVPYDSLLRFLKDLVAHLKK